MTPAEAALARNDRYLFEFVERLNLCPFARRCRETGKLHRRVVAGADAASALQPAREAIAQVEALPADDVEVALLIFPDFAAGPKAFDAFCGGVRGACRSFYCVAFHPELPEDLTDANRAVAFIRRSPDPTLQLVRSSLLTRVRGEHTGGSVFVDISKLSLAELVGLVAPEALADRIARQNLDTVHREGPDHLRTLLLELHRSFRG